MILVYHVSKEFVRIEDVSGTIQNVSNVYTVEVSDRAVENSGVLIFPLNQLAFCGQLFMRCTDGFAEVRVVPFGQGGGISAVTLDGETYNVATASDISDMLNSVFEED